MGILDASVPHIQDFTSQSLGKNFFSKIDWIKGYDQNPVHAMDIPKTVDITPLDLFEFLLTPFGLAIETQAFQSLVDIDLQGLDCVLIYLNDILVASYSLDQDLPISFRIDTRKTSWMDKQSE